MKSSIVFLNEFLRKDICVLALKLFKYSMKAWLNDAKND